MAACPMTARSSTTCAAMSRKRGHIEPPSVTTGIFCFAHIVSSAHPGRRIPSLLRENPRFADFVTISIYFKVLGRREPGAGTHANRPSNWCRVRASLARLSFGPSASAGRSIHLGRSAADRACDELSCKHFPRTVYNRLSRRVRRMFRFPRQLRRAPFLRNRGGELPRPGFSTSRKPCRSSVDRKAPPSPASPDAAATS